MLTDLKFHIRGLAPMIQHNGQLTNPRNPIAREMKALTGKRKKTDADAEKIARLEWIGSLYTSAPVSMTVTDSGVDIVCTGRACVPGENIERMLLDAAKTQKMGKLAQAGLFSDGAWPVEYDGPKDIAELADDDRFIDIRRVKVQQNAVMRCRPIFRDWSLAFTVTFNDEIIDGRSVSEIVVIAGRQIGIGDFRPKFGRFEVIP